MSTINGTENAIENNTSRAEAAALFDLVAADRGRRKAQLGELVSFRSLAFPGYDLAVSVECAQLVADMLRDLGFANVDLVDIGSKNPLVWAETNVGDDAPTILLYAHYDVQPAPMEQGWDTDPWTMIEKDGRLYGRGAADNKAGIVQHISALHCLCEQLNVTGVENLPFNIKICFEGEEEYGDSLPRYIPRDPERFKADVFLVCDGGNLEIGKPILQTTLRGIVELTFSLKTLPNALHSGQFGGVAPDAFIALTHLVQTMYDAAGNTRIDGIDVPDYAQDADYSEELFRKQAQIDQNMQLVGSGSIADRLWARPAIKIVGLDMPDVDTSSNIVIPEVRARASMRIPVTQDGAAALEALKQHIIAHTPWGAEVAFGDSIFMDAFSTDVTGPYATLMKDCLEQAFNAPCGLAGSGGSIPLLGVMQENAPGAEFLLFGPIDSELSNIHGANESVSEDELEKCAKAQALFLLQLETRGNNREC